MGGKEMKTKLLGILVLTLLIATALPAAGITNIRENEEMNGYKWFLITIIEGEVENISEENIDDVVYYNCTAVDVSWIQIVYVPPLWFKFERGHVEDSDDFFIIKALFYGVLKEGQILGILVNYGET